MSYENPAEERRLQFLVRAEQARTKAEETDDPAIREWWSNVADAWDYLAVGSKGSAGSGK
ncbi:MAG TPA: hypothetical protein VLC74_04980 [Rhizomicrobium sp.]|nr:hypothetical protein [Rhizomicrobium sp.]